MLQDLFIKKKFKRFRESSYDRTGGNQDCVLIPAGETFWAPALQGPGIIRHLWLTLKSDDSDFYRKTRMLLQFDEEQPLQVDVPLADFFLFGHGTMVDVNSIPIQVSFQTEKTGTPGLGSLNSWFPMPFAQSAKLGFANDSNVDLSLYFYADWEQYQGLAKPVLHFRATLRDEFVQSSAKAKVLPGGKTNGKTENLSDAENYVFLDVKDFQGHYVGTGLSVECKPGASGKWWEGDDMFVIDGEPWPPRLHGTGTEDYFNLAWGFRKKECRPEYGVTFLERFANSKRKTQGKFSVYRFHINDPIAFERSLRASIEHGHANDAEGHYRSIAYWYGRKR